MKKTLCVLLALCSVLILSACSAEPYTPISWEYLSGLPEGFPKLCDAVTANEESFSGTTDSFSLYWNVLDEDTYNGYLTKIEEWASAKFGEAKEGTKTLSFTKDEKELTVKASYNADANGKENAEAAGGYNCQALITVNTQTNKAPAYETVKWEYIYGLPESFPKLCDSVTTVDEYKLENGTSLALYWNRLEESAYKGYLEKMEKWAGAEFGEPAADGTASLSATVDGEEITVKAAYNKDATGIYQTGNKYDFQARIEVVRNSK